MNNNLKVLDLFVKNKMSSFSIKNISDILRINYKIVYYEIKSLNKDNLISMIKSGNANMCSFNYVFSSKLIDLELIRISSLSKNIKVVMNRLKEIDYPFFIVLLFGSFANGTAKKNSDIDLCVVANNTTIIKKVNQIIDNIPLPIDLHTFTSEEFSKMISLKKQNVGNEILKNNIVLKGIESFYELIKNVVKEKD